MSQDNYIYANLKFEKYYELTEYFQAEYNGFKSSLFESRSTGHLQYYPMPENQILEDYYNGVFTRSAAKPTTSSEFKPELLNVTRGVKNYINSVAGLSEFNVHDIGCGFGAGVWAWQQIGVSASGNEANKEWVDIANPACNYQLFSDSLDEALKKLDKKIDLFFCAHVLEHLADPLQVLITVEKNLSENGVVYIVVPNNHSHRCLIKGRYDGMDFLTLDGKPNFPMHLNFFTPLSLISMLRTAGLEAIQIETRPLDELPEKNISATWREDVKNNLLGGELFVLACKPENTLAKRNKLVEIIAKDAYNVFFNTSDFYKNL